MINLARSPPYCMRFYWVLSVFSSFFLTYGLLQATAAVPGPILWAYTHAHAVDLCARFSLVYHPRPQIVMGLSRQRFCEQIGVLLLRTDMLKDQLTIFYSLTEVRQAN